jgi:hypothetical protein
MKKTLVSESVEFDKLIKKLTALTENNDHGAAYVTIAKYFNLHEYAKIFEAINTIHVIEGYLPRPVSEYRYSCYEQLMFIIKEEHTQKYNRIYSAL